MNKVFLAIRSFLRDEEGVTIIEYALIAALIALGIVAAALVLRSALDTQFRAIATCIQTPTVANCGGAGGS